MEPAHNLSESETSPRLLDALAGLSRVGAALNRFSLEERASAPAQEAEVTLRLIVKEALQMLPGALAAVIYAYDAAKGAFIPTSRVAAGHTHRDTQPVDAPRVGGLGIHAVRQRRRVTSYENPDLSLHPALVEAGACEAVCLPLVEAGQPVGAFYLYLGEKRPLNELELLLIELLGQQAATAIYQARWLEAVQGDLERKEEELGRLRRADLLISSRRGLEETLEAILQMALEVTGAEYGIFRLVDPAGGYLITRALAGEHLDRPLVEALPVNVNSVMGWVAVYRQPVCIHDLRSEPWAHIYYPLDAEFEMRSELAVPLIGGSGRLEGVLNLESPEVGAFDQDDRRLLQSLATQAVIAIQEIRLLDALQEVAQLLLTQPCQQVLARLVELAGELLNASASAIWTRKGDELVLEVASEGYQHGERLPLHGSLTGQAVLEGGPVTSDDLRTDARFHRVDLARAQDWVRALVVPLLASNGASSGEADLATALGAFSVYSAGLQEGRFIESEWDEKVLTVLAHYAALAVHNAARQEALREAQERHAMAETFAAVGDIAANLLHQLNNRVGTIPVRVQGIQAKCGSAVLADPYLAANLDEIERSASEAMEAVRENLAHLHPLRLAPVDVAACAQAAVRAASLPDGVRVQLDGLEALPTVVAGQRSLTLVFANLFQNAAEAMDGRGAITVRGTATARGTVTGGGTANGARPDAAWVELAVHDTGPGIRPELHDRIFEFSYYRAHGAGSSRNLGFGLWWVKSLMVRLGGSVTVESDGQHGTTFYLRLPRDGRPRSVGPTTDDGRPADD